MSAQILRFPSRPDIFTTVRVIRDRDTRGWLVIAGEHGWDYRNREDAIAEALMLARDFRVDVVVTP
jgi:hypothetical protein